MPQYEFLCKGCKKTFSRILTIARHDKEKIACPHCGSKNVEQRWAAFYAVTSKKSAWSQGGRSSRMRFDKFSFGSIQIDGSAYEHDVVVDRGEIRKRKKKPYKRFR